MQCYEAINNITLEDIEGSLSFSEIVGNIIDQRTTKINKKKKWFFVTIFQKDKLLKSFSIFLSKCATFEWISEIRDVSVSHA